MIERLRLEYASENTDESVAPPALPSASGDGAAQVAAAIAGPEIDSAPRGESHPASEESAAHAASATAPASVYPSGMAAASSADHGGFPVPPPFGPMTSTPSGGAVPPPASYVPVQPLLFEIAWEVCWQLGGIYTVIRSKAPQMTRIWGERYCLIGPYNADTAAVEVEESQPSGPIAIAIERLRSWASRCITATG